MSLAQAMATNTIPDGGIPLPVIQTPCQTCPKMALYPEWHEGHYRGLHPGNELAVQIYQFVREDQRVGVFDSAPLLRTIRVDTLTRVLDEFDVYLPTWLDRKIMFEKVLMIDRAATNARGEAEQLERDRRRAAAEAEREQKNKKR